jgi:hypothetical protein
VSAGKIVLLVFGIIVMVVALGLVVAGGGVLWANGVLTDDDGYFTTRTLRLDRDSYAIVTEPADVDLGSAWACDWGNLVTFKVEGSNDDRSKGIFIGVADERDLQNYLSDVEYDEIIDFSIGPDTLRYRNYSGASVPESPVSQTFWSESVYGSGEQVMEWELESGSWSLVLMNEDGSDTVDLSIVFGAKVPWLFGTGIGLLIGGVVGLIVGFVMVYLSVRRT